MSIARQIIVGPLKLVLQISSFAPKFNKYGLIKKIWEIGHEPVYAGTYIFLTQQEMGIENARLIGKEIFEKYPSDRVAGIMGALEFDQYNLNDAKKWLELGKQCPQVNPESLLFLELELADHLDEYNIDSVINKILSRRDLSMNFTRKALWVQAELYLRAQKWSHADEILEKMMAIEDIPRLRWMKWTIAKALGDEADAQNQLNLAKKKTHKEMPDIFLALGWYYLGDIGKSREFIGKAMREGITKSQITRINPELGAIVEFDNSNRQPEEIN